MVTRMRRFRLICMLTAIMFLLPIFTCTVQASEADEQKKVRVGYMIYEGYQNGEEGEPKSGSAYEYYQKLKYYTDWKYEYVYGSISETFKRLENGEIDIMACVTYSDKRAEKYFFSNESHGLETYFLYTHLDNNDITPGKLESLNGKNVGVVLDSYQEKYFGQWCEANNIVCNIIPYEYVEDLHTALTEKEIDAMIESHILGNRTELTPWKSIYRFAAEPLYFAVSKTRPDILQELNNAQAYITSIDEYYSYETMKKYHDGVNYHNAYLTPGQEKYIENSGKIKVGYLEGMNPLSFTDPGTGKMTGLCAEYLDVMSETYGIEFETYAYRDENELMEDLLAKKVDIIVPLGMGYWVAEQLEVSLSTSICNLPMSAIYINDRNDNMFQKIAVNRHSPTQEGYVAQFYPDAEVCYVENTQEALNAVENGTADVYFVRSSSLEFMGREYGIYDRFRTMSIHNDMEAFMATRIGDTTLSVILDKGISLLTDTERDSARFRYTYDIGKISLWQAIEDNMAEVAGICIVVILLFAVMLFIARLQSDKVYMKKLVAERDKAEKAERAKTDFLSQMSHDIRTPMNAIIGFTNFIKEENDIGKIREDYVPKIEMASSHLIMLIDDVLEMGRIDTGKLVFQNDLYNIKAIIESVVIVMRTQAEGKNLKLLTDISVKDDLVYCDKNHMSRVIMNLLSNAVKFTPDGGKVSLSVYQQSRTPDGYAAYEVKVSDTGIGMEPEFMERVFMPFERERTSTISGMQGTGLGMAIVKNIVDAAGGTITVESTPGKGTTFTMNFTLKCGKEEQPGVYAAELEEKHYSAEELKVYFSGKRILLVEDNEINSMIAQAVLEKAGFLVEIAENGQEAVDKVVNAPSPAYYDTILMDIQMPVMNGYEATEAIRKLSDERAKVKIIAVTANAFASDKEKARKSGMDGHVPKPLDVDVLYKVLLEAVKSRE